MINYDFSVLDRIGLEYPVVGVKYSLMKPAKLPRLKEKIAICEMNKYCQDHGGFYAEFEDHGCKVGPYLLGQMKEDNIYESGQIGPKIGVYEEARANRRIYTHALRLAQGTAPYIWFARANEMDFSPDVLLITARPQQAEVLLRAHGYRTGEGWEAKGTTVAGCEYMYVYPYLTGKLNILISGLHHGMKARALFPEGLLFMSFPFDKVPELLDNLETMEKENKLDLPQYHWGKENHEKFMPTVAKDMMDEIEKANARKD